MWLRKTLPAKKGVSIVATLCGPSAWPNPPNHVFTHPSHYVFTHPYTRLSTCPRHSRTAREQLANNSRTSKNTVFLLKTSPREQSANNSRTIREQSTPLANNPRTPDFPQFHVPLVAVHVSAPHFAMGGCGRGQGCGNVVPGFFFLCIY